MFLFDIYDEKIAEIHKNNHKNRLERQHYIFNEIEREGKTNEPLRNQQRNT